METISVESIKEKIKELYESKKEIHLTISLNRPKIRVDNAQAKIEGVYPFTFRVEEFSSGFRKIHTLQYTDVMLNQIEIPELNIK